MKVEPLVGKQAESVRHLDARLLIWEGAVRSSKTICSLLAWLKFIRTGPTGPLLMVGRTERTLIRNLLDPLVDMLGIKRCRIVSGAGIAWILGRKVYLVGANDERAQEKIRGLSLAGAYADELSTLPESFWTMLLTRLSISGARAFASTNPDGPSHWLKKNYLDKARLHLDADGKVHVRPCEHCHRMRCVEGCDGDGNLELHRFSFQLTDNPTLDPDYVQAIRREFTGLHYRRLIKGEWCLAEGVIYDMFDPDKHVLRGPLPNMIQWPGVGVDVGTTNPFAAILLGVEPADGNRPPRLVAAAELRYDAKKKHVQRTDPELSRDLAQWITGTAPEFIAVDPAAASFKVQLHQDGVGTVMNAMNDVSDGIRLVSSLLATGRLVIHESCQGLIDELGGYVWDPKAAERGEDRPLKVNDHSCDALRYACLSTRLAWQHHVNATLIGAPE